MIVKTAGRKTTKIISLILSFFFLFEQVGFAQVASQLDISGHIAGISSRFNQDKYRPLHLRYLSYDNINNDFELLLDKGDYLKTADRSPRKTPTDPRGRQRIGDSKKDLLLQQETEKLMKYFLVGVSLPNESFWVNLRPDAENNIIDTELARTDVGRVLLESDLQLKKDTAKFTSPATKEGKIYWDRLYKKAQELFGYENITIPTLTRPWIVPGEIVIRETADNAYIYKATLKVMLEEDYLKNSQIPGAGIQQYEFKDARLKELNKYSTELIKELIIPKITKEVNTSKRYAGLRQVYYSLIMAQWFKQKFYGRGGLYSHLINRQDLRGLVSKQSWSKTNYFKAYQESFKQGEYNLQEPVRTPFGQTVRSYFSGGLSMSVGSSIQRMAGVYPEAGQVGFIKSPNTDVAVLEAKPGQELIFLRNMPVEMNEALQRVIARTNEQGIAADFNIILQEKNVTKVGSTRRDKMLHAAGMITAICLVATEEEIMPGINIRPMSELTDMLGVTEQDLSAVFSLKNPYDMRGALWELIDPGKEFEDINQNTPFSVRRTEEDMVAYKQIIMPIEMNHNRLSRVRIAIGLKLPTQEVTSAFALEDPVKIADELWRLMDPERQHETLIKQLRIPAIGEKTDPDKRALLTVAYLCDVMEKEGSVVPGRNTFSMETLEEFLGLPQEVIGEIIALQTSQEMEQTLLDLVDSDGSKAERVNYSLLKEFADKGFTLVDEKKDAVSSGIEAGNLAVREAEKLALEATDEAGVNAALAAYDRAIKAYKQAGTAQGNRWAAIAEKKKKRTKKSLGDLREMFTVIGEDGRPTGEIVTRFEAHRSRKGIRHDNANLMVLKIDDDGVVYFLGQKREETKDIFPGAISNGAAGHVIEGQTVMQALVEECAGEVKSDSGKKLQLTEEDITLIGKEGEHEGILEMYEWTFFNDKERDALLSVLQQELAGQTGDNVDRIFSQVNEELGVIYLFTYNKVQHDRLTQIADKVTTETGIIHGVYTNNVEAKTLGVVVLEGEKLQLVNDIVKEVNAKGSGGGGEVAGFRWLNFMDLIADFNLHPDHYTDAFAPWLNDSNTAVRLKIIQALPVGGENRGMVSSGVNGIIEEEVSSDLGGIDFTVLPFVNKPVVCSPIAMLGQRMIREILDIKILRGRDLGSQLSRLEEMVAKGIIPSMERIKQCVSSCCRENGDLEARDRLAMCVGGILRLEEEQQRPMNTPLLAILSLLDSGRQLSDS